MRAGGLFYYYLIFLIYPYGDKSVHVNTSGGYGNVYRMKYSGGWRNGKGGVRIAFKAVKLCILNILFTLN